MEESGGEGLQIVVVQFQQPFCLLFRVPILQQKANEILFFVSDESEIH